MIIPSQHGDALTGRSCHQPKAELLEEVPSKTTWATKWPSITGLALTMSSLAIHGRS
jgi:hypothetical protein